jgi:plastocyanin domain-containing protein
VVEMKIVGNDYIPNQFSVVAGTSVEWRIDASRAAGCGRILLAPSIGVQQILSAGKTNTITFMPDKEGTIAFNCGMGMMTPNSKFVVRPGLLTL